MKGTWLGIILFASAFAVIPVIVMVAYILGIRRTGALENL